MKRFLAVLALAMSLGVVTISGQTTKAKQTPLGAWTPYNSVEGGFAVQFPGVPSLRDEKVQNVSGQTKHIVELKLGDRLFQVIWVDVATATQSTSELSEESINQLTGGSIANGGRVMLSTDYSQNDCYGKEVGIQTPKPAMRATEQLRARAFTSGDRTYLIKYASTVTNAGGPSELQLGDQFLNSFAITGTCKPHWVPFVSVEGGFTAKFPLLPETSTEPADPSQPGLLRSVIELTMTSHRHYEVSYVDFMGAPDLVDRARMDSLDRATAYYESQGGKLLAREDFVQGGCHGEQMTMQIINPGTGKPATLKARAFSSGRTVYLVYYGGNSLAASEASTADEFLGYFKLMGDCHSGATAKPVAVSSQTVSGITDPTTGWLRIDSPYGVSFLMPAAPTLKSKSLPSTTGPRYSHSYFEGSGDHSFWLEVTDLGAGSPNLSPAEVAEELDSDESVIMADMAENNFKLSPGKPIGTGKVTGREYQLTAAEAGTIGRVQLIFTPT